MGDPQDIKAGKIRGNIHVSDIRDRERSTGNKTETTGMRDENTPTDPKDEEEKMARGK